MWCKWHSFTSSLLSSSLCRYVDMSMRHKVWQLREPDSPHAICLMPLYCRNFRESSSCIEFMTLLQPIDFLNCLSGISDKLKWMCNSAPNKMNNCSFELFMKYVQFQNGYDAGHQIIFSSTLYLELWNLLTLCWGGWLCRGVAHNEWK